MNTVRKLAIGVSALSAISSIAHAQASDSATASGSATIIQPITASAPTNLAFGTIVKPTTGTGTVAVDSSGNRTVTGAAAVGGGVTAASFSVVGEGAQAYSLQIPSSFTMASGTNTLVVTTNTNSTGSGTLSGALGAPGSATFGVGGTFNLNSSTASGAYTGNIVVTASYQ